MLALLLVCANLNPRWPTFNCKFVPVPMLGTRNNVLDARVDLSAVGWTITYFIDVDPTTPLAIMHGKPVETDAGGKSLWPYRFAGWDKVVAFIGKYPDDAPSVVAVRKGDALKVAAHLDRPEREARRGLVFHDVFKDKPVQTWVLPEVAGLSTNGYENHCDLAEAKSAPGWVIENVTYYPITANLTVCEHDDEATIPALRIGNRHRLLRECVNGANAFLLDEVVWAAPSGWMVVRARKRDADGYLWLFPK